LTITAVKLVVQFHAVATILHVYCWCILIWRTVYMCKI